MNTNPGIIGTKIGMTQLFLENGKIVPCTVIQADCRVVGKRTEEKDGYSALIVGSGERKPKHMSKALAGSYKKSGQTPARVVRELRLNAETVAGYEVGQ
ncbi:MAG TPA: 50S ribosomal protein L3, partial [Sorangium sp.]|nr:50S ribosomal protein L3 [Sorangium sp.]